METPGDQGSMEATIDPPATGLQPGRNIILLSDGTGNSAAKLNKTNVWRLYQALELSDGSQIAFYDDGVGTSGFKPLKLLGGALGVGLARNVRDLYRLLCQHYLGPDKDYAGDRIYIFGFSRGAFTARILADLICKIYSQIIFSFAMNNINMIINAFVVVSLYTCEVCIPPNVI